MKQRGSKKSARKTQGNDAGGGQRWLDPLLGFPARRPWLTLIVAGVLAALSIAGMTRLHASTNLRTMLAKGDPSAEAMAQIVERFGFVDEMYVLVTQPHAETGGDAKASQRGVEALAAYAQRFEAAARGDVDLSLMSRGVSWAVSPEYRRFVQDVLAPAGVFYLSDDEFKKLHERLKPERIAAMIAASEAMLEAPGPAAGGLANLTTRDPLKLHEFLIGRLAEQRGAMRTYENGDAFISPDGSTLLIRVAGVRGASDLAFAKNFAAAVRAVAERADPRADGVALDVQLTGAYAIATQSERAIRRDMIENIVTTSLLLPLLFLIAYRSLWSWPLAMTPLVWGIVVSFGAYSLITTEITPLTGAIGAVLAGLSVDYCIHYLSQYMTNRRTFLNASGTDQFDIEGVTILTARTVGLSVSSACATSLLAFIAIGFSHVQAMREFAILASLGLLFVGLGVFSVLPALLALTMGDGRRTGAEMTLRFSLEPMVKAIARRATAWLAVTAVVVCAAAALVLARAGGAAGAGGAGGAFAFESDLSVMHPRPNPPLAAQHRMAEAFGVDMGGLMILLSVPDSPDASNKLVSLAHEVDRRLREPGVRAAHVGGTIGLATLLPDPAATERRLAQLRTIDASQVSHDLRASIEKSEYLEPAAFDGYVRFVEKLLTPAPAALPTVESLRGFDAVAGTMLPRGTFDDMTAAHATQAVTMVWMDRPMQSEQERTAAIGAVRTALAGLDGATLTGLSVLGHDTERVVMGDLSTQLMIATVLVVLWMVVSFRSLTDTLLSLLPAAGTLAVLLALMNLAGQRFNLVNLITLPMLVGIGVDYGIFLVCVVRIYRMARANKWAGWERTLEDRMAVDCHALTMTTASTVLGLGTLAFTSVPAIASLGWAAGGAMAACLSLTVLMLMPMLILRERAKERREAAN